MKSRESTSCNVLGTILGDPYYHFPPSFRLYEVFYFTLFFHQYINNFSTLLSQTFKVSHIINFSAFTPSFGDFSLFCIDEWYLLLRKLFCSK